MTDTAPAPRVTNCDICQAITPADIEARRTHRAGHTHDRKVIEALREALKDANRKIADLAHRLNGLETDVAHIEIPEPVDPFAIVPVDDLEPLEDDIDEPDEDEPDDDLDDDEPEPTAQITAFKPASYYDDDPA